MKLVAIMGSRNPEGQTARATGALLDAVREAGWEVEQAFLPELTIERCRQCEASGRGGSRGE